MDDVADPNASENEPEEPEGKGLLDRLRGTGVGVEDPNIVGDVGPTDIPPGADPDGGLPEDPDGGLPGA